CGVKARVQMLVAIKKTDKESSKNCHRHKAYSMCPVVFGLGRSCVLCNAYEPRHSPRRGSSFLRRASPGLARERRDTLLVTRDPPLYPPAARLLERALKPTRETSMKTAAAVATAVVLFASISGASAQNLPGKYNVEGKNLDGSAYSGTAEILATSETTCRI